MKAFSTAIASGALANLKDLWLDTNQIGDEGMKCNRQRGAGQAANARFPQKADW